ncbi:MAG: D-2-hydroxyacid dehydrogenase [Flavobacteriaceae bacterium]|nr:D-2-hydroxyacid dehydrogenase [Flavobacteriaceae bacterium]MBT4415963.1 D-2-hydroxyacid dehydrogenase [Flavobacteriaceae bacterium]MBT5595579.1 D-2-hydroxyacid dehydrogenase [Flavobacteriaceae bacterium]MBT5857793.1 D-2-hydroxyacid dehydrogenase [Flavobacteriaceae bacterium]MBT7320809.1 D-2-hydroxyacid dehydrogenase [Flavobacteriaceae bacterium]
MNVLANDGISKSGKDSLEKDGFNVSTVTVAQNQLISYVNKENISVLLVRSATTVRKDLIDQCPGLKIIGRGGVGMDNIDVDYARNKGINVINTPAASSASVAELVFAHLYSGVRFLFESNRAMPLEGDSNFKGLKKTYAKGVELRGKTIGIIGFGRIGRETAKIAIGVGMKVLAYDKFLEKADLTLDFHDGKKIDFEIKISKFDYLLKNSDFISLHVPAQKNFVINKKEINMMKDGAGLINAARGGVVNEVELVSALDSGKLSFAGLDTFENEPKPAVKLLMHPKISLTPHIGAATNEAQDRIGLELADQIKSILN